MPVQRYSKEEVVERGNKIYEQLIRSQLTGRADTDFIAIDVDSEDFEVGPQNDELAVTKRLLDRRPNAQVFGRRVGYSYTVRLGGGSVPSTQPRWRRVPPKA